MPKQVILVKSENKQKVEDLLKRDDITSRGSITIKQPASLDIDEEGYFFILDMSEDALARVAELTKDLAAKYEDVEKVIHAVDEQENSALEGFGNILG